MNQGKNNPAYKHGHTTGSFSPTYQSWANMIQRCTNPKRPYYKYYGGKGIKVHPAWQSSFSAFLADMGERPMFTTLDRIDSEGDYTPDNCRWATLSEQSRHRTAVRDSHLETILDVCQTPTATDKLTFILKLHKVTVRNMICELRDKGLVTTERNVPVGKERMMTVTTVGRS